MLLYRNLIAILIAVAGALLAQFALAGGPNTPYDRFTNIGSMINTRHNLSLSTAPLIRGIMNTARNDYDEVCVYCHTPHGSNTLAQMPLWNRTIKAMTYTTYNSFTLTQGTAPQPGNNSRTCLSCHDGQTAIDSIINMPGSGKGLGTQGTTQNLAFLNTWTGNPNLPHMGFNSTDRAGQGGFAVGNGLGSSQVTVAASSPGTGWVNQGPCCGPGLFIWTLNGQGCLVCHAPTSDIFPGGVGPDFTIFNIGTDLTNDHPIGIDFPLAASGIGYFKQPTGVAGTARFFDNNTNGHMDKDEPRLYATSGTVRVECASCHDPHGVPDPENGNVFKPTFLRIKNGGATGSALCLTCHNK